MEKFGIFDLLDALSAATSSAASVTPPSPTDGEGPAAHAPNTRDAAFSAPVYGASAERTAEKPKESTDRKQENAYSAFLSRHEQAVKRIEKKS